MTSSSYISFKGKFQDLNTRLSQCMDDFGLAQGIKTQELLMKLQDAAAKDNAAIQDQLSSIHSDSVETKMDVKEMKEMMRGMKSGEKPAEWFISQKEIIYDRDSDQQYKMVCARHIITSHNIISHHIASHQESHQINVLYSRLELVGTASYIQPCAAASRWL